MEFVRPSNFAEFVRWYITRERRKDGKDSDLSMSTDEALLKEMRMAHPSKLRPWFRKARWSIVSLTTVDEAMALVCVDSWELRADGRIIGDHPDNRLARSILAESRRSQYFDNLQVIASNSVEAHFRQEKLEQFRKQLPRLCGAERLTICTPNAEERTANPGGNWYLHDGFGRLLPWLYVIVYEGQTFYPIEAFCAEESAPDKNRGAA